MQTCHMRAEPNLHVHSTVQIGDCRVQCLPVTLLCPLDAAPKTAAHDHDALAVWGLSPGGALKPAQARVDGHAPFPGPTQHQAEACCS